MSAQSHSHGSGTAMGRRPVLLAVFVVLFLAATDGTVMSTLLPIIANDLGQRDLYPWIMSGFLLPMALIAPLSGALADRFGALRSMVGGILLFLLASTAAALSPNLPWLIAARVGQGAGAGMIIVLSYTLLATLFGPAERARMQGMLSGVWGLAAIFGPLVGAALNATLGWRWVFWINLPIGLVGLLLLSRAQGEAKAHTGAQIFPVTQTLFAVMIFSILWLLTGFSGDTGHGIDIVLGVLALLAFITLYFKIRKAPDRSPVPVEFFWRRDLLTVAILVLLASSGLYASVTILPFCLHDLHGWQPLSIGFLIMAAALGWVVGSAVCGNILKKQGYRKPTLLGAFLLVIGTASLALTAAHPIAVLMVLPLFAVGLGTGFVATSTLVLSQNMALPTHIGSYTSTIQLLRNLGAAFGVNALAAIQIHNGEGAGSFAASFTVLAGLMALGLPLALLLPSSYGSQTEDSRASCVLETQGSGEP